RVLGFDIDVTHFADNKTKLLRRGAFRHNSPEVHEYDQLADGRQSLTMVLGDRKIDIAIDDGLHSIDAIVTTWRSVRAYLSRRFVYFIEDFPGLLDHVGGEFSGLDRSSFGIMTVISSGLSAER